MDLKPDTFPVGKRITLHRTPTAVKEENLEILKFNMQGKQLAQKLYYEKPGQSPLLRNIKTENKRPVHERLGVRNTKQPFAYDFSTFTPIIRNKRFRKGGIFKYNKKNYFKRNLAQARIQRIRQQRVNDNTLNALSNSSLFQKVRLKRYKQSEPINYIVQVENENAYNRTTQHSPVHSVPGSLNNMLQEEIKVIQSQNVSDHDLIPNSPIFTTEFGVTDISLHNRFSSLP